MDYEAKKIVAILSNRVPADIALNAAIAQAKADPSLLVAEYPREMLDTRTDDDLAAALAVRPTDELEYLGAVIYGDTDAVNAVTGRFQLWKPEI